MEFLGVSINMRHIPVLDKTFIPLGLFNKAFLETAKEPLAVAVYRNNGLVSVYDTFVHGTKEKEAADFYYVERLVKFLLWARGGYKATIFGGEAIGRHIQKIYAQSGARAFDNKFMSRVYERAFEVTVAAYTEKVKPKEASVSVGRHFNGNRIGFDAGGSDRKVSAVINGKAVFSEECVWYPKVSENPDYHLAEIIAAFQSAAAHMPSVDAIGISSAGVYVDNRVRVASLFLKVPDDQFDAKVKNIYLEAAKAIGKNIPLEVANDGDVTALAGAMELGSGKVLGIAMGTSEAVGYVDAAGNLTGWLNELAFAPVDAQPDAGWDEWSGDIGCGVQYFSQDSVIKLAPRAGLHLDEGLTPGEKLKTIQGLHDVDPGPVDEIYETIGCYLGHTLPLYAQFYDMRHVLLLGRVMSGQGGNLILEKARQVIADEYPELDNTVTLHLPDEKSRRVGQSIAAASLPQVK